jgi:hypothetical protein
MDFEKQVDLDLRPHDYVAVGSHPLQVGAVNVARRSSSGGSVPFGIGIEKIRKAYQKN